jgi:DNA-binding winged helix-turn-helix (wHTH) protein/tetratricopeptide (TPR) repeat protein
MRSFPPFRLDEMNQCLWRGDTRISLMPKPFAVLKYLVDHAGCLVTHDELLSAIWPDTFVQPEVLRRYVLEIRRALGDQAESPRFIETRPKRGYQFIAEVSNDSPVLTRERTAHLDTTLVGRASALASLNAHLDKALGGERQIVFVVGEPGIGKTRLVDAFQHGVASALLSVARGQSVEGFGGKEPYYPIFEAIAQLARGPTRTLVVETLARNAPTWLIQFASLVQADQHGALQRETLGATRERMVRELCEALEVMTSAMPLVLVLEDLHWVDHSTIDLISAIARRREPARLLLVGTFRPAELILTNSPLKALKHDLMLHRLAHEVTLDPLSESDVGVYLKAQFVDSNLPRELAAVIHRHSDGNPLFMTAILDHLAQKGALTHAHGRWTLDVPIADLNPGVPDTLKQMLELQMRHLTEIERQFLKCASVAGQRFTAWAIAAMLMSQSSEVEQQCAALTERHQFLTFFGTRDLPDGSSTSAYEFAHALYREVLYRGLGASLRVTYHKRLAEGIEGLSPQVSRDLAAELASHFEEGRQHERAIHYLILASNNAARRYAHRESIAVLEHARELLPRIAEDKRSEIELLVLEKLGNAFYAVGDMERSAETYQVMATRAVQARLLSVKADALLRLPHTAESIPFFARAVELEPDFVTGYVTLSRIYSNLGDAGHAKEYARHAYERRERTSGRELLSLTYQYHYEVTGDQNRATQTLEEWKASFPSEFQPVNSLTLIHNFLGRFERAIDEGHEAIRRNPSHGYPYSNLAQAYLGAGRPDDAQRIADQAVALEVETLPTRRLLYHLAMSKGDHEAARKHAEWARDKPREFDMVGARAQVLGWSGQVHEAWLLYERAVRLAELRHLENVGTTQLAWATWMHMAYGNIESAQREAHRVLVRNPSYDPRLRVALTLAATGFEGDAESIADEAARTNPEHTLINLVLVPIVRAGVALARKDPSQALEQLQIVSPYELGFVAALAPLYLRGRSFLMRGAGFEAAHQFQRILDRRGTDPFSPFHAVARLGLARSLAMGGEVAASLEAYRQFLASWSQADPDIPVLREARDEYRRLSAQALSR